MVAALKNVDFPVLGFPTTPSNREYDLCIIYFTASIDAFVVLYYLRFANLDGAPARC
jgi:hypothetical protein